MMSRRTAVMLLTAAILQVCGCEMKSGADSSSAPEVKTSEVRKEAGATSFYTVAQYDPAADPSEDLAATVLAASKDGKRIILEVGGQW